MGGSISTDGSMLEMDRLCHHATTQLFVICQPVCQARRRP